MNKIMRKKIFYLASLALLCGACSDSDEETLSYAEDAQAVHFTTSVARLTRAADETATLLPSGSKVSLSDNGGSGYTEYYVYDESGNLSPEVTTSFLRWKNTNITQKELYACSPAGSATSFTLPTNQSTEELLTAADYLTFHGTVTRQEPNSVSFTLSHRLARVNLKIVRGESWKYDDCTFDMKMYSRGSKVSVSYQDEEATVSVSNTGTTTEVTPFGGTDMVFGEEAQAILVPCIKETNRRFLSIQPKMEGVDFSAMYLINMPELSAGCSYDYELTIEDDVIYISSVTTTDWDESELVGDDVANFDWYTIDLDKYDSTDDVTEAINNRLPFEKIRFKGALKSDMTGYSYFSKFAFVRLDLSMVTGSSYVSGSAFYGHSTLKEIHLPEAVTNIGSDAFQSCSALETIDIPGKVTMNTNCFRSCGSLVDVTIPHAVRLYADVFHDCQKLRSLILPEATSSGWWIFTDAAFRLIVIPKVVNMDDHYLDAYGSNQTKIEMVINQSISYRLRDDGASYYGCSDHTTPMRSITVVDDDGYVVSSNKEGVTVGMHWTNINFDLEDSDEPETADE
jgi:hypothetical protein